MKNIKDAVIRLMSKTDLPDVYRIQKNCYPPSFIETPQVFNEKRAAFPNGCFVAIANGICAGYIFSHPWIKSNPVPLNKIYSLPLHCDCFHIHDCSIDPAARENGIGKQLVNKVFEVARKNKINSIQLISVQKSQIFWERFGFSVSRKYCDDLYVYGKDAVMMSAKLPE